MLDDLTHQERLDRNPPSGLRGILQGKEPESDRGIASCKAFGYHLGPEHLSTVEFRFLSGDSTWFPYSAMGVCRHIPSEGLLLKFSGDLIYLVLVRGSNLDRGIDGKATDLIHAGLQRQHVLWLKEMTPAEIREVGEAGPTIDKIEVAEFESHAALKEWLEAKAPAFVQGSERLR
jgi:hypothetical protein